MRYADDGTPLRDLGKVPDINPWGAEERMSFDHNTGVLTLERTWDIGAVIDQNVEIQNGKPPKGEEGDFWLYARIPDPVLLDWWSEYRRTSQRQDWFGPHSNDEDYLKFIYRRLNDSGYRKMRTILGNL